MNRRTFLGAVGGIGVSLSGCLGQDPTPAQPTESPTPSPTVESRVDVPPCPDKPDSLSRENVLQFAIQLEKAFVTRTVLQDHERVTSIDVDIGDGLTNKTVSQTDDGWLVRFTVAGPAYRYLPSPNATETAHVDPPLYAANYFITDRTVLRAQAAEAIDPRENGTVVHCPPE